MHAATLKLQFEFCDFVLRKNLDGISNEDALVAPDTGGNCINWVLGHIVHTRNAVLPCLGVRPLYQREKFERYQRGTNPVTDGADAATLNELVDAYGKLQTATMDALDSATEETFAQKAPFSPTNNPDETVGSLMGGIAFHEAYHVGQTSVIRRIAGKAGALG